MPPRSTLLATTTAGATFGQPRLRGTSPFPFATKQTFLQFGDLGFEGVDLVRLLLLLNQSLRMQALVIMSLLAQLDVFQPKFFLNLSHWKARLPEEEKSVPHKLRPPENSLWSRCLRRNPVLVIHRILTLALAAPKRTEGKGRFAKGSAWEVLSEQQGRLVVRNDQAGQRSLDVKAATKFFDVARARPLEVRANS